MHNLRDRHYRTSWNSAYENGRFQSYAGISNPSVDGGRRFQLQSRRMARLDRDSSRTSRPLGSSMERGAGKWTLTWKCPDERLSQRVYSCYGYCGSSCYERPRSLLDGEERRAFYRIKKFANYFIHRGVLQSVEKWKTRKLVFLWSRYDRPFRKWGPLKFPQKS